MVPGDRLICTFTQTHEAGERFSRWLLHATVVPWFRVDTESEAIARDLATELQGVGPFTVNMGGINYFGRHKAKRVNLIVEPTPLAEIESLVRSYLHGKDAWLADETTRLRRPFKPHVTAQGALHMNEGNRFRCDRLYIVEQLGNEKAIAATIGL